MADETNNEQEVSDNEALALARQIAADEALTANIGARFAAERAGRGADGWERF